MELDEYLDAHITHAREVFDAELSTDENKDYRRGFRAGLLVAYLHIKSNIRDLDDATTEPTTD